jgi:hypothetical protein
MIQRAVSSLPSEKTAIQAWNGHHQHDADQGGHHDHFHQGEGPVFS